jgi:2'-5' RNA ligase
MSKRRLFLSIPLPEDLKDYILSMAADFQFPPRLTPVENLHITVKFYGGVEEEVLEDLITEISDKTKSCKSFKLDTKGFRVRKKMIWLDFLPSLSFRELASEFSESDERPQIPHVTVSRMKEVKKLTVPEKIHKTLEVRGVELWESKPGASFPRYSLVKSFPFF